MCRTAATAPGLLYETDTASHDRILNGRRPLNVGGRDNSAYSALSDHQIYNRAYFRPMRLELSS